MGDDMGEESFPGFLLMMTDEPEEQFLDDDEADDGSSDRFLDDDEEDPDACDDGLESPKEHGGKQCQDLQNYARRLIRSASANRERIEQAP